MKRNYEALFGSFYQRYLDWKNEEMSDAEALAITYDAYYSIMNRGEMEKAVVNIAAATVSLTHTKVYCKFKVHVMEQLLSLNKEKLRSVIQTDEYKDIVERMEKVLEKFEDMAIDQSEFARWHYFEMEKAVKECFATLLNVTRDEDELVGNVLNRFERDCNNTPSENMVIKTTLAELIIRHRIEVKDQFARIKRELERFDILEVGQDLTEFEKKDLSLRIGEILGLNGPLENTRFDDKNQI
ncbi:Imm3 family immunity protein [Paenibacillus hubeiensis]|uniref:Imm3 family immunity protein n=1 Tax=Paenibacillus hubeiensis TaxID=3077330 RepID=UPI0031BAB961